MSRDINLCHPTLRKKIELFRQRANEQGIYFIITCIARTEQEQYAIYVQGRETLAVVNSAREHARLGPITDKENITVTWTLDSKHVINDKRKLSEAFDIAIVVDDRPTWNIKVNVNNNEIPDYLELAEIGRDLGLKPGAFFSKPDYPHYELA